MQNFATALSQFTNTNAANVTCANEQDFKAALASRAVAFDTVNDDAFPVLVYMQNNAFVAYFDPENECGFITTSKAD